MKPRRLPAALGLLIALLGGAAAAPSAAPPGPEAIEQLVREQRWAEALEACALAAAEPGRRDLAQLLWQYGTALEMTGRPRDASIMFLRQALLFPSARQTPGSLVSAASIVHDEFDDARGARLLLQRAVDAAAVLGDASAARRAEALRAQWNKAGRRGAQ